MQINVTAISNGFIVAFAPTSPNAQATIVFCEDYDEVCAALKKSFPPTISR